MKNLKERILALGLTIPGTIRQVMLRCGRDNCACVSGHDRDKHGPYYFWSYKNSGKLTSVSLTEQEAKQFQKWIDNRRALEELVHCILEAGVETALKTRRDGKATPDKKPRARQS